MTSDVVSGSLWVCGLRIVLVSVGVLKGWELGSLEDESFPRFLVLGLQTLLDQLDFQQCLGVGRCKTSTRMPKSKASLRGISSVDVSSQIWELGSKTT